ncbi:MAG TPA: flagellar hook capping FlgD N-terminal domain-containing protein [Verrucomicrobiae bacterium]|nr:flagellar hook capping FlgD N-terminal domain-containing protein [Verrucomicrobiae bacterium]
MNPTSAISNSGTNPVSPSPAAGFSPGRNSGAATDPLGGLASEQAFLQLLVAQLQNQDPTAPQDGIQFVAQLAQFSSLEQQIQMRTDLDSISGVLNSSLSAATQPSQGTTQQS